MFNCTLYKVTSTRQIWPYVVGDEANAGAQFMPRWLYRAPQSWGQHAGKLICEGVANHSFSTPAPNPGEPLLAEKIVHFVVDDQGEGQKAKLAQIDANGLPEVDFSGHRYRGAIAPQGFGAFGGQRFVADMGTVNLMQTSTMPDAALPYDAEIYRIDEKGERRPFARNLQGGHPQVKFHAGRMLIGTIGKSYSTGDFHHPDGSLIEVVYTG